MLRRRPSRPSSGRFPRPATPAVLAVLALATLAPLAAVGQTADEPAARAPRTHTLQVPADLEQAAGLAERAAAQGAAATGYRVPVDFHFTDRLAESGITFRHRIVDDAGLRYKPVHYDHGDGVAVADVDGDGRLDLYFLTQLGDDQLWRNLGGGRFEDVTEKAGVAMSGRVSVAGSFADVDGDGDADLFVTTVRHGNALFLNDGKGHFTDVTEQAGLSYSGHSSGAVFFDYDHDGRLDLFLTNVGRYTTDETGRGGYYVGRDNAFMAHMEPGTDEPSILYHNTGGGRFADVSETMLLVDRSWSGDAVAADLDGDGWEDLYVLDMQGADHFYKNVRGELFLDQTAKLLPRTPPGSMGVVAFDWNRDRRLDLYVTDMHSDMREDVPPAREKDKGVTERDGMVLMGVGDAILGNAFYEATGDGFREISDRIGVETYWPWGVSAGDLNADGWPDLYVTGSMNFPFRYGLDSVLLNERGERFVDAEIVLGVEPPSDGLTVPWFEIDCPQAAAEGGGEAGGAGETGETAEADFRWTWGEVAAASKAAAAAGGPHPLCRGRSGRVTVMAARGSRSSVVFDLDDDGDLDVVTNEFNAAPRVLVSDLAQRHPVHFLKVRPVGSRSNRSGLGALVTVTAGGVSQLQVHNGKSGYLSQSLAPLYFGLGEATKVDRVEVTWPSGEKQVIESPEPNRLLTVTEPSPEDTGATAGDESR